jgi:hypothetical protein
LKVEIIINEAYLSSSLTLFLLLTTKPTII